MDGSPFSERSLPFLDRFEALVTYVPLRTEVPLGDIASLPNVPTYTIEPRASLDPHEEAKKAKAFVRGRECAILIPGRTFDTLGTRHGQGGGWYDRFLAEVPRSWTRVGVCFSNQLSSTPLTRESWDQPMDTLLVYDKEVGAIKLLGVD